MILNNVRQKRSESRQDQEAYEGGASPGEGLLAADHPMIKAVKVTANRTKEASQENEWARSDLNRRPSGYEPLAPPD